MIVAKLNRDEVLSDYEALFERHEFERSMFEETCGDYLAAAEPAVCR